MAIFPDMVPDIFASDRGESIAKMEPVLLPEGSRHRGPLNDLAVELTHLSAGFRSSLPRQTQDSLADLVRAMNCYYSNLIEGHDTHPIDIERALGNDYSQDLRKRNLQIEARAHVSVQAWIDQGGLRGASALSAAGISELHQRFCGELPDELLWTEDPDTKARARVVPGEFRTQDVRVGQHVAVSPGAVPRFLARFEEAYARLGKLDRIVSVAAAHHRLLWIHPFLDGNGRVARLMSHAHLLDVLDTGSVWSVARGLARNVEQYKFLLAACDAPRRNDLDGRGTLSEEALAELTKFFLSVCIDQVRFMAGLVQPDRLRARVLLWAEEEIRLGTLAPLAARVLEAVLHRGEIPRAEVNSVTGTVDRHARRIVSALVERGVLSSKGPRAPLHLVFPATLAHRWLPGLFPERPD